MKLFEKLDEYVCISLQKKLIFMKYAPFKRTQTLLIQKWCGEKCENALLYIFMKLAKNCTKVV